MSDDPTPATGERLAGVEGVLARSDEAIARSQRLRAAAEAAAAQRDGFSLAELRAQADLAVSVARKALDVAEAQRDRLDRLEPRVTGAEARIGSLEAVAARIEAALTAAVARLTKVEGRIVGAGLAALVLVEAVFYGLSAWRAN